MYFLHFDYYEAVLNEQYKTFLLLPYLKFQHCTLFKTTCMNNIVDTITLPTADVIIGIVWLLTSVILVIPQVVFKGGYIIASLMYNSFHHLDDYLQSKNYTTEPNRQPNPMV